MTRVVYSDEGIPVRGKVGRPAKPAMTEAEFQAIVPILSLKRRAKGSSLQAAASAISRMRGVDSAIDPRTKEARSVSARWIGMALAKRGIAGKTGLREKYAADSEKPDSGQNSITAPHTGSRMGYATPKGVLGENHAPLSPASTGQEIAAQSIQENGSRPEAGR